MVRADSRHRHTLGGGRQAFPWAGGLKKFPWRVNAKPLLSIQQKMPPTMKTLCRLLLLAAAFSLRAADTNTPAAAPDKSAPEKSTLGKIPDASHAPVRVTNTVTIAGERVTYIAETGMLPLLKPDGTSRASVFYVAYTRVDKSEIGNRKSEITQRPVTFSFNGGPGSASVWLHLGALGPRRVKMNEDGSMPAPPFALVDNEFSLLNASDLVFIDPVATGFSRATKDEKPDEFFGDMADLDSVGEFIRLWTTRHDRWLSPKFVCGESYGVYRAAGLAEHLRARCGMYLNGLILVSGVLDFGTICGGTGNDLPYSLILPAYTAAAHYHKKLPADLSADLTKALAESREFAKGEFTAALLQGAALSPDAKEKIIAELVRLTGLNPSVIEDNNLRVDPAVFRKQLLHDEGLILGAYDGRLTGRDGDPASPGADFDPASAAVMGPFSAAMNSYVRGELKFEDDLPYELLTPVQPWNYGVRNNFANASDRLASVMNQEPYLKILVLGGRCDLVCPIDTMRHSVDHMGLADAYRKNVAFAEFDAGHMMYINLPDLKKMQAEIGKFVQP
jgi:carboxypeptidase C (cathepsin A)